MASDRATVSANVVERTGHVVSSSVGGDAYQIPSEVRLEDGLSEDEAVLLSLWNNAAFQEQLADLGIVRGDLVQAGLLPNPEFAYLFGVPFKPYRYLVDFPLEALWLRPIRIKAAANESARVGQRLTQVALDLIRDVRQAHADVILATGRMRVAEEGVRLRGHIAKLAETRFKGGDISSQEAATARVDSLQATQEVIRITYDLALADERLRNLLALGKDRTPLILEIRSAPAGVDLDAEALTNQAIETRPDVLAAEQNIAAAAERVRLSKLEWVRLLGIGDATSGTLTGHEFGPGVRATLPIFNWNQGNIARAEAELEKAQRQRTTLRNQIILEVRQAHHRFAQARAELDVLETKVKPEVQTAIQRAELAYREGNTPYVVVLETTRQLLDSLLRQEQLQAELRRSWAELERSVGRRLAKTEGAP